MANLSIIIENQFLMFLRGSRLKKVTPKKMLERLPVALAQVKSGNNLNKIMQIVCSLYQSKETTKYTIA